MIGIATVLAAAGTLRLAGAPMSHATLLAGTYDAVAFPKGSRQLSITDSLKFTRWCFGSWPRHGSVKTLGTVIFFRPDPRDPIVDVEGDLQEYEEAVRAYVAQQYRDHGYYPNVASPPVPSRHHTVTAYAPVKSGRYLFLVDLFDRTAFCDAVATSSTFAGSSHKRFTYRRRGETEDEHALAAEVFCDAGWKPRSE